ncbi:MAG: ribosome assembly RNA-binding protein YhbY [Legionella sp.]|nr:ribosome assembly RNA-binding protein YhbY [Legionella sp.]
MDTTYKQSLKKQAHHLKPVILLGAKGLTEALLAEAQIALEAHELIKVKLHDQEKTEKMTIIETLCNRLSAELIQTIGNTATIYRKVEERKAQPETPKKASNRKQIKKSRQ